MKSQTKTIITVENVSKSFMVGQQKTEILKNVNLEISFT
jgi:predicted ABC-type transport system involved in lysophospholipase L1 biosynthesis ATPase subunit